MIFLNIGNILLIYSLIFLYCYIKRLKIIRGNREYVYGDEWEVVLGW